MHIQRATTPSPFQYHTLARMRCTRSTLINEQIFSCTPKNTAASPSGKEREDQKRARSLRCNDPL